MEPLHRDGGTQWSLYTEMGGPNGASIERWGDPMEPLHRDGGDPMEPLHRDGGTQWSLYTEMGGPNGAST